jgi:hypothetical protein
MLALMVSIVLIFLGMGLILQTSLGLQAAGTDRWVVKALSAADSGAMLQVLRLQRRDLQAINTVIVDDPSLPGLTQGQFAVQINQLCETEKATPILGWQSDFETRHFHLNSIATRAVGGLTGLTRAEVEMDVSVFPFDSTNPIPVTACVAAP